MRRPYNNKAQSTLIPDMNFGSNRTHPIKNFENEIRMTTNTKETEVRQAKPKQT